MLASYRCGRPLGGTSDLGRGVGCWLMCGYMLASCDDGDQYYMYSGKGWEVRLKGGMLGLLVGLCVAQTFRVEDTDAQLQ